MWRQARHHTQRCHAVAAVIRRRPPDHLPLHQRYTSTFAGWDTYQEASVAGVSTDTNYRTTTNTLSYDAYGRLIGQREHTNYSKVAINDRQRYYAYTGDGLVQLRREGEINKDTGVFEQKADGQRAPGAQQPVARCRPAHWGIRTATV